MSDPQVYLHRHGPGCAAIDDHHVCDGITFKPCDCHLSVIDALRAEVARLMQERDRETDLRRDAEAHIELLKAALEKKPYQDEVDQLQLNIDAERTAHAETRRQLAEVRTFAEGNADIIRAWQPIVERALSSPASERGE